jgi:hypothetical protein
VSDTITLDTEIPTGSIQINANAIETSSATVTLSLSASDANGIAQMRFSNDGTDWTSWEPFFETKTWTLTPIIGTKLVFAQFKDNADLNSTMCSDTIALVEATRPSPSEPTPKTGNIIIHVKDKNNAPIEGATVTSTNQPAGQPKLTGTTDATGTATFQNIVPGAYTLQASKQSLSKVGAEATVKSQETTSIMIKLVEDFVIPTVSLTIANANSGLASRSFTVTANGKNGNGIANITLYVDGTPVASWNTAGTYTYSEGVYSKGRHTCYVEAYDNQGAKTRDPPSEILSFYVSESTIFESNELWKIVGVILVIANGAGLIFLSLKRRK